MLDRKTIAKIREYRRMGWRIRGIAKKLKVSKSTVLKYLKEDPSEVRIQTTQMNSANYVPRFDKPCRVSTPRRRRIIVFVKQYKDPFYNAEQTDTASKPDISITKENYQDLWDKMKNIEKSYIEQLKERKNKREVEKLSQELDSIREWRKKQWDQEKKKLEELNQKSATKEEEEKPQIYQNTTISNNQNKPIQVVLQSIPQEESKKIKQTANEEINEYESEEKEQEQKQTNILPWLAVGLKIVNDIGFFKFIGTRIGESIVKPAEPIKVRLREIKKGDKKQGN